MKKEIVKLDCIKHIYSDKTEVEICGLSFVAYEGDKVALIGPNGSGKTTLLNHIIGILRPIKGKVRVFGLDPNRDFQKVIRKTGVVFQDVNDQLIGPTVWDDILFSPMNYGLDMENVKKEAEKLIKYFEIEHLKHKIPHYLSGGEKKKVAIVGALITQPELLILDEPFGQLDDESKNNLIKKLDKINKELKTTIIISTNDLGIVKNFVDVIYLLEDRKIKLKMTPKEFFRKRIKYKVCRH